MKSLLLFLMTILFFSCKEAIKQNTERNKINPIAYSVGGGNKVVFLGDYYIDYLNALRKGSTNSDSLYRNKIQYPIINNYFSSCEYSHLISYQFINPLQDTTKFRNRIRAINNNREKIEKIISSALIDCNKYLRNDSITIYIQPYESSSWDDILKRMGGVSGVTGGSKQILLTLNPDVPSWSNVLAHTLAHEFNHTYWTKMNFKNTSEYTLLSYLVFEGSADAYAHFIYPLVNAAWDTVLSDKEKSDLWRRLKPQLQSQDMSFQREVMFGSKDYPLWGGYCLGYTIVQSALKNNPKLTPMEWASLDPEKILEMSGYK